MNLHQHLAADHVKLRDRIAEVRTTLEKNPAKLEEVFLAFQKEVRAHLRKEDEVYYVHVDAGKKIKDRALIHDLRNDHAAVVFTLESLLIRLRRKVPMSEWQTKFEGMIEVMLKHFNQEENSLFPEVERTVKPAELESLFEKVKALE